MPGTHHHSLGPSDGQPDDPSASEVLTAWFTRFRRTRTGRVVCFVGRMFAASGIAFFVIPPPPPAVTASDKPNEPAATPVPSTGSAPGPLHPERVRPDIPLSPVERKLQHQIRDLSDWTT